MSTIRIGSVSFDCAEPAPLAAFWASLLGGEIAYESDDFVAVKLENLWLSTVNRELQGADVAERRSSQTAALGTGRRQSIGVRNCRHRPRRGQSHVAAPARALDCHDRPRRTSLLPYHAYPRVVD